MPDVYDQHAATFRDVHAWVICNAKGERVATFACKHGRGGASGVTCTAYLHIIGLPMVRHREGPGGGYDMKSAAFHKCAKKCSNMADPPSEAHRLQIIAAMLPDGPHWDGWLRDHGYKVHEAV